MISYLKSVYFVWGHVFHLKATLSTALSVNASGTLYYCCINKQDAKCTRSLSLLIQSSNKNRCRLLCLAPPGVHLPLHPPEIKLDMSHVLVLSYNLVNNKICLKQIKLESPNAEKENYRNIGELLQHKRYGR